MHRVCARACLVHDRVRESLCSRAGRACDASAVARIIAARRRHGAGDRGRGGQRRKRRRSRAADSPAGNAAARIGRTGGPAGARVPGGNTGSAECHRSAESDGSVAYGNRATVRKDHAETDGNPCAERSSFAFPDGLRGYRASGAPVTETRFEPIFQRIDKGE